MEILKNMVLTSFGPPTGRASGNKKKPTVIPNLGSRSQEVGHALSMKVFGNNILALINDATEMNNGVWSQMN